MTRGPMPAAELEAIAAESSQTERRADDAERELIEWKKIKFMEGRVGEDFDAIVLSCTKYGFFVELEDLFIEGLVPIASLGGFGVRDYREEDRYVFRDTDRTIVGQRSGRVFRMGLPVRVLLDRIDRQQRRLQFALIAVPGEETAHGCGIRARTAEEEGSGGRGGTEPGAEREGEGREGKEAAAEPEGQGEAALGWAAEQSSDEHSEGDGESCDAEPVKSVPLPAILGPA